MKTILITGGSGLVGSAIKNISLDYCHNYKFIFISSNDCDLTDYTNTFSTFSTFNPDYVIHLAACVGGLFKNMAYKVDMFEKILLLIQMFLKFVMKLKLKKL